MVAIKIFSAAMMKVCADSWQNNKKATVLPFKTGNFFNYRQKIIFLPQGWFLSFCQFFDKNKILQSLVMPNFTLIHQTSYSCRSNNLNIAT